MHASRRVRTLAPHLVTEQHVSVERLRQISRKTRLLESPDDFAVFDLENGAGGDGKISAARVGRVRTHDAVDDVALLHGFQKVVLRTPWLG